jgi:hypothetical protein
MRGDSFHIHQLATAMGDQSRCTGFHDYHIQARYGRHSRGEPNVSDGS